MPSSVVKSLAEKSGKSIAEVEKAWDNAKAVVKKEYPDIDTDGDKYWAIVTGITKKMIGIKETFLDTMDAEMQRLDEMGNNDNN